VIDSDASPYLAAADIMVTDHSSVGFEFLVLDRPLIVYDAPDLATVARINPEKIALLRSAAAVVRTPVELVEAARNAVAAPAALSEARCRIAAEIFYRAGTATGRALSLCYTALNLPMPEFRSDAGTTPAYVAASLGRSSVESKEAWS
jgi:CDP-glycerol glycerophosphotransferase (TagB/SpsB family)